MPNRVVEWLTSALPIAEWLPQYGAFDLQNDAVAGLTVGITMIPKGMAYAVIAGMPPIYGLYAALVPLVIYAILGTSTALISGAVSVDMVIIAAGVGMLAEPETDRFIALVILLTGMVGVIQIAMAFMRLGFLADLISRPVIAGFTTAAAFIIGFSQVDTLLGIDLERSQYVYVIIAEAVAHITELHLLTFVIGLATIGVIFGLAWWRPILPGPLIVVIVGTLITWAFGLHNRGVEVVGDIPTGLPSFQVPEMSGDDLRSLLPTALTLALVQFMNVVSLGRLFAMRRQQSIDPNQELFAIGSANLVGCLFRAVPVSGSYSMTTVNDQAGARTPMPNIITAALMTLTLVFLTPLFYYLPMAVLAGIIIMAAVGLFDYQEIKYLFQTRRREGGIALFTFVTTLVIGIQEGILLGIGASIVAVLYQVSRPNVAELGHLRETRSYHDVRRFDDAYPIQGILVLRVNAAFSFANAEYFKDFILDKSRRDKHAIRAVVIDGASINDLDTTAAEALSLIIDELREEDIELYFTGVIGPVRDTLRRSGLYEKLGEDHFFESPHDAVTHILAERDEEDDTDRLGDYLDTTAPPEPEQEHEEEMQETGPSDER